MHRELAKRANDGIIVRLVWDEHRDRILLRYRDSRTGEAFVAEIPRAEALNAFNHPNVYRLGHGPVTA